MIENKLLSLAKLIKENTISGKLTWTKSGETDTYRTKVGIGLVSVKKEQPNTIFPTLTPFAKVATLDFMNDRGQVIGSISCDSTMDSNYELVSSIYDLARNSSLKIDDTLESMFDDLDTF